ncbi:MULTISPECIES: GGDEF domain-containing protein [unclassified Butyrivibrio]|uniref:GGDEF domain-containing protein n=1 Tax=unclassified Butyrivibrio TaxID=2639466 RepID=UPI0003B45556|nr:MULTISPECIES: GGDEF domain-containing protein [unclassified Butyrivibrio]
MRAQSINHYGYDKETKEECTELINGTNRKHVMILNIWFFIVNVLCIIFSAFDIFSVNQSEMRLYIVYAVVSAVFFVVCKTYGAKPTTGRVTVLVVVNMLIWMAYSIQISIDQPYMAATLFMVMLVVLSFSFISTMLRTLAGIALCCGCFLYCSFKIKAISIAEQDLYNVIIFVSLSIVLHFAFQRTRMQQFVTMQKNIQIQRELEIKSSFDALTSLLNRGRFFSLAGNILSNPHDEYIAICLLDLDEFKQINDKLGHQMGDKAIQIAGQTIIEGLGVDMTKKWTFQEKVLKEGISFPGRLGGDEFIVFIRGKKNREEVTELLQNMLRSLNSVEVGDLHGIHASLGVTEITENDRDIDVAYKRADEALYESKRAGKNQIRFMDAEE